MKRIISLTLAVIMLCSMLAIGSSSAGTLVFEDDFESGFAPRNWLTDSATCAFVWDKYSKCIHGYDSAVVLQSNFGSKYDKWWAQYYTGMDFQVRGYDDLPEEVGRTHYVSVWYNDLMERGEAAGDVGERGANYLYTVEIETGKATLTKSYKFSYKDANGITQEGSVNGVIAEGQIEGTIEVGETAPWYNIGMRVSSGKIECYLNEKLVLSSSVEDGTEKIGDVFVDAVDATVGSEKSAILFFNGGCWIAFDNFQVWTPDYDFEEVSVVYGDVNGDAAVNLADVTKMLQAIAKWEVTGYNEVAANVNGDDTVNLSDVTKVLQYIAKWEGVVLG